MQGITGLYFVDKFGFTTGQAGVVWMVLAGVLILVQTFLTGPLERKTSDKLLILIGVSGKGWLPFAMVVLARRNYGGILHTLTIQCTPGIYLRFLLQSLTNDNG
ncbi:MULTISPECIES: hypothetical protein [Paenibacillus]|uniref:hypothetical protein n=1 Tax=Paenibacillus TaxID=44249 RepID=UPI002FE1E1AD